MSRDIRHELEKAGRRPAPDPDPAFAEALQARLLAVAATGPRTSPQPRRRSAGMRWQVGMLAAGLAVVVLTVLVVGRPIVPAPTPSAAPLELTATVNVIVTLVDGTTIANPDGLYLPEGATVTVGDGGSAQIGDVTLQAGEVVGVHDGRLQVQQPASVESGRTQQGSPGASSGARSPGTGGGPSSAPASREPTTGASPTSPSSPSVTPIPTAPPTSRPTTAPTTGPTLVPSPTPVPTLRFRASLVGASTISVTWSRYPGARSYVLVGTRSRIGTAARPTYPGSRILGTFARRPATPLLITVPTGVLQVKLLLVALDGNGNELFRSRIIRIDLPAPVPAASQPASPTPSPTASPSPTPS